jgi:putative ABC transport system permease protein
MNLARAWTLALRNLSSTKRAAAFSAFGVALGVSSLVFFAALGTGVSTLVRTRILPVDFTLLEVKAPSLSLGGFIGGGTLDDEAMARLRALPGVVDAYPTMEVRIPASSRFNDNFFGRPLRMYMEVVANGVDPRLVESDLAGGRRFEDPGPGKPLPVVANSRLLELYNASFAPQRGLPKLDASLLAGLRVPVIWGQSYVAGASDRSQDGLLELVGFSTHATPLGATMPLDAARRLNRELGRDDRTYSSVVLRTTDADELPRVAAEVRRMGFEIDEGERKLSEQVGFGIAVVTAALGLLSLLIGAVATLNVAQAFHASVRERRREIGILRSLGASARDVQRVVFLEAVLVGLVGSGAGLLAGIAGTVCTDFAAVRYLPEFPFKPDSFFAWPAWLLLCAPALGILSAVVGAWRPARSAALSDPAVALGE